MTGVSIRPDFDQLRRLRGETRSPERLAAHYDVETRLAGKLANSRREDRLGLYADVYRELFAAVPDHPQHFGDRAMRLDRVRAQARWLSGWLAPDRTYVEIGCGDAALTKLIAERVHAAIGVDVTSVLVTREAPAAFRFLLSDGITLNIPTGSVDLVYSNQLMEHLHTEDSLAQLREIHRVLRPGGRYICCTPNRLTGPHDISVYFGHQPTGFHMREYDHRSLSALFRDIGFGAMRALVTVKGRQARLPVGLMALAEGCIEALPRALRTRLMMVAPVTNLLGVTIEATKV